MCRLFSSLSPVVGSASIQCTAFQARSPDSAGRSTRLTFPRAEFVRHRNRGGEVGPGGFKGGGVAGFKSGEITDRLLGLHVILISWQRLPVLSRSRLGLDRAPFPRAANCGRLPSLSLMLPALRPSWPRLKPA